MTQEMDDIRDSVGTCKVKSIAFKTTCTQDFIHIVITAHRHAFWPHQQALSLGADCRDEGSSLLLVSLSEGEITLASDMTVPRAPA